MMDFVPFSTNNVQYFLLVFVRIVTIMALLPIFGSGDVPVTIKIGLSIMLSIVLFPFVLHRGVVPVPMALLPFVIAIIKEVFVGLVIGFASSFLFMIVQFAGYLADSQMGFTFVEVVDPFTDMPITTMGQLQIIVFSVLFLLINGHYFMILAIQKSFELIPLMGAHMPGPRVAAYFTDMTAQIFVLAIRLAAPIFATLLLTSVALAIVARTVPQINVFFVGVPVSIAVGMGTAVIVLPMLAVMFRQMVDLTVNDIWKLLYLMAAG